VSRPGPGSGQACCLPGQAAGRHRRASCLPPPGRLDLRGRLTIPPAAGKAGTAGAGPPHLSVETAYRGGGEERNERERDWMPALPATPASSRPTSRTSRDLIAYHNGIRLPAAWHPSPGARPTQSPSSLSGPPPTRNAQVPETTTHLEAATTGRRYPPRREPQGVAQALPPVRHTGRGRTPRPAPVGTAPAATPVVAHRRWNTSPRHGIPTTPTAGEPHARPRRLPWQENPGQVQLRSPRARLRTPPNREPTEGIARKLTPNGTGVLRRAQECRRSPGQAPQAPGLK
jgi:hypothetical protein